MTDTATRVPQSEEIHEFQKQKKTEADSIQASEQNISDASEYKFQAEINSLIGLIINSLYIRSIGEKKKVMRLSRSELME